MRRHILIGMGALLALLAGGITPAQAGWKRVDANTPVAVAKSGLTAKPERSWNRWTIRPVKQSEVWTIDGLSLNELYFVAGLPAGKPMLREFDKKDAPLPKFSAAMLPTDLVDFVETSSRSAMQTSLFEVADVRPAKLAGYDGVRFDYSFAVQGNELLRRGMAVAAVIDGKFYMASFSGPAIHYFDRDKASVERLFSGLALAAVPPK